VIRPVILCGGAGVRLWPASTPAAPKQFLSLAGPHSLFQATVLRLAAVEDAAAPLIVVGAAHLAAAREQLAQTGAPARFLVEPQGRDSGPALIAAALAIAGEDPEATILAVASDHHIPDVAAFAASVAAAAAGAQGGDIVTFGVRPTHPATVFGYIEPGEAIEGASGVRRVRRFIEKPDAARAAQLIEAGCLWNSGNFVFRAGAFLSEARRCAPAMCAAVAGAVEGASRDGDALRLGEAFRSADALSIDVAVMEKTARAAVLPISYAWSDLGSWRAVWEASERDAQGNAIDGAAVVDGSENCLVRASEGARVVAVGLKNIAIVVEGGKVLVCDLAASPDLKAALARLGPSPPAGEGGPKGRMRG
jgi:mannose-1-phosphate guanylyltransferase/mannose-6-phosphate isomerase